MENDTHCVCGENRMHGSYSTFIQMHMCTGIASVKRDIFDIDPHTLIFGTIACRELWMWGDESGNGLGLDVTMKEAYSGGVGVGAYFCRNALPSLPHLLVYRPVCLLVQPSLPGQAFYCMAPSCLTATPSLRIHADCCMAPLCLTVLPSYTVHVHSVYGSGVP